MPQKKSVRQTDAKRGFNRNRIIQSVELLLHNQHVHILREKYDIRFIFTLIMFLKPWDRRNEPFPRFRCDPTSPTLRTLDSDVFHDQIKILYLQY